MLKKAQSMGIDYIATGHYARITFDPDANRYLLYKSATEKKDQTYALYNLTQYQLSKTLFPIGDYSKDRVRSIAKELGLSVSSKPDSQEICFVDDNDYGRFIRENSTGKIIPGNFIDTHGNILGRHSGIVNYTIGQRKGLGITFGKPMFVTLIDPQTNNIILGETSDVFSNSLIADDLNFISIANLTDTMRVKAKIRYSAKEADATITPVGKTRVEVIFDEPQRAVTPGQSVVFYDGDFVIGGGTIIRQ
jgi:tRNA-specific 2-thiouridylase